MDPLTLIVAALAAGASAALKPTAENAVKDAYAGLKRLIKDRYERAISSVETLERRPASESRRAVVKEDLEGTEAPADKEVRQQAQELLRVVKENDPEAASNVGINFDDIDIEGSLSIEDVEADGSVNISTRRGKVGKDVTVSGVRAGRSLSEGGTSGGNTPS